MHLKITTLLASIISNTSPKLSSKIFSPTPPELLIISLISQEHTASNVSKSTFEGVHPASHTDIFG